MDMDELYRVEDIAYKELKTITDNGKFRSREEIDNAYKIIDILKDIRCLEDYPERESYRGRRRDSMGRYASDYRRYPMDSFMASLKELMESAPDDQTRKSIQRMIDDMG